MIDTKGVPVPESTPESRAALEEVKKDALAWDELTSRVHDRFRVIDQYDRLLRALLIRGLVPDSMTRAAKRALGDYWRGFGINSTARIPVFVGGSPALRPEDFPMTSYPPFNRHTRYQPGMRVEHNGVIYERLDSGVCYHMEDGVMGHVLPDMLDTFDTNDYNPCWEIVSRAKWSVAQKDHEAWAAEFEKAGEA